MRGSACSRPAAPASHIAPAATRHRLQRANLFRLRPRARYAAAPSWCGCSAPARCFMQPCVAVIAVPLHVRRHGGRQGLVPPDADPFAAFHSARGLLGACLFGFVTQLQFHLHGQRMRGKVTGSVRSVERLRDCVARWQSTRRSTRRPARLLLHLFVQRRKLRCDVCIRASPPIDRVHRHAQTEIHDRAVLRNRSARL